MMDARLETGRGDGCPARDRNGINTSAAAALRNLLGASLSFNNFPPFPKLLSVTLWIGKIKHHVFTTF